MPVTEQLDHAAHLVRMDLSGSLTTAEMIASVNRLAKAIGQGSGWNVFSDHRKLETPATTAQLEALLDHIERTKLAVHGGRWAIVTGSTASYGMMRMLSVLAQRIPVDVSVFQDPAEAEAWISG